MFLHDVEKLELANLLFTLIYVHISVKKLRYILTFRLEKLIFIFFTRKKRPPIDISRQNVIVENSLSFPRKKRQ